MDRIVIFAKAPLPGLAKTRLAPLLGSVGAAEFAREMLGRTCSEAAAVRSARVELCVTPAPCEREWDGLIPDGVDRVTGQGEGDLGQRLMRAAKRVLAAGERIVLIGTDCPALDRNRIAAAFDALNDNAAFLYPTVDGGYALLGLTRYSPALFCGVKWSSASVFEETTQRLQKLGWRYAVGDLLRDIDEPGDFEAQFGSRSIPRG